MKKILVLNFAIALLLFTPGCKSPQTTAYVTRGTFDTALTDCIAARKAEKISAGQFKLASDVADTAVPILDEMDRAASAGDGFKVWIVGLQVAPAIDQLVKDGMAAKGAK